MQTKSICYPRFIFVIVMIIVSTVILTKLLYGSTWLQKTHRYSKIDGVREKVSNLLEKLIKLNSSLERPSHKTFQLLVILMHILKDESLGNKNIFKVLKKISQNKNEGFRLWKKKNGLYNANNAKSVLDQLSSVDHYVNLIENLRNFNYSQEKGSPIINTTQISKLKKRPKVEKFAQYDIKKTNSSQKILKQIYNLHSHIKDSNHGNTITTSEQNSKSDRVFNDSATETIDNQSVALQRTALPPKATLSTALKSELYESKASPTHKPEDKLSIMQGNRTEGSVPSWLISSASIYDSWTDSCTDETSAVIDGEEEDLMDIETYIPFNKTAFNIIFLSHPSMFPIAAAARILKLFLQVTFFLAVAFLLLIVIAFAEVREVHGYLYIKDRIDRMDTFQSLANVFGSSQGAGKDSTSSLHLQSPSSSCSSLVSLRSVLELAEPSHLLLQKHGDRTWRDRMFLLVDDRRTRDMSA